MARYLAHIDSGDRTHLALCSCGWRGATTMHLDHARAQLEARRAARHEK